MDTFTTTFSLPYPSPAPHTSSLAAVGGLKSNRAAGQYDPDTSYDDTATLPSLTTSSSTRSLGSLREHEHEHEGDNGEGDKDKEGQVVQQLCRDIAAREGCVVTAIAIKDDALGSADSPKHTQRSTDSAATATTTTWSFCISGTQSAVLAAKGAVLREMPRDHSTVLLAKRADILVSPYRYNSTLKPAVKARLDSIASTTNTTICIPSGHTSGMYLYLSSTHSSPTGHNDAKSDTVPATPVLHPSQLAHGVRHVTSGSAGSLNMCMGRSFVQHRRSVSSIGQSTSASHRSYGSIESLVPVSADSSFEAMDDSMPYTGQLEKEKTCEIVIGGDEGSVGAAKVGVLVMLDVMSGLHAQSITINHTLQPVLAGRRGAILQNIQEETSTNIYLSASPLGAREVTSKPIWDIAATSTLAPSRSVVPPPAPLVSPTSGTHIRPSQYPAGPPGLGYQAQAQMQQYGQYRSAPYQSYHPNPYAYPYHTPYDPNASYNQSLVHYSPLHPQAPAFQPRSAHAWATPGMYSTPSSFAARTSTPGYSGWSPNPHTHSQAASLSRSHGQGYGYGGGSNSSSPYMLNGAESTSSLSLYTPSSAGTPPQGMYRFRHEMMPVVPSDRRIHLIQAGAGSMTMNGAQGSGGQQDDEGVLAGKRVDEPLQSPARSAGVRAGTDSVQVQEPVDSGLDISMSEVWVTGEQAGVSRAIEMLKQLEIQKTPHVMSVTVTSSPRKLDWLLLFKAEELRAISYNNATYLQMPSVGSQVGSFTVIGDHRVGIERSIRQVMALISQCVSAAIWLLSQMPNGASTPIIDHEQLRPILRSIARNTATEIVLKDVAMEVYGLEEQVRRAITTINDIDMIQHISREIRFRIELANEHRDFVTGKKNGKISKITKTANVKIKFEHSNDYTFILELSGAGAAPATTGNAPIGPHHGQTNNYNNDIAPTTGFFAGLQMLLDEMPAELSFHVPESHHKRIIGVQGKTIQAIMKDLGVYVKFSSADEHAMLGGYDENEDNVIARTPRKNGDKLERLKKAVMDLVLVKDRDYVKETIKVPGYYHRTLYGSKHVILRDIEKKTGTQIRFPPREDGRDEVVIYGPKGQLSSAGAMLLEHLPLALELRLEATEQLSETLASADFTSFIEQIKRERRTAISIQAIPPGAGGESVEDVVLLCKCPQSAAEQVGEAKDALMGWFAARGIDPLNRSPTKRSQILRQQATRPSSRVVSAANSSTSLDAPPTPRDPLRTRPASTTNAKALFEGTSPNNRFTMPLAALKNGASPDRGFLTMVGNKSPISVTAPNTANMWQHQASPHASKSSISGGGLPFMSATSAGFFEGRPDVLKRQQSLAALGSTYSALGLQTLSSASEHGDADDMTPRASVNNNGRLGTPPHVPVPAQIPVSGPRTRLPHYHLAPGASIGGLSLVDIHNSGDFTPFTPTAVDGLHDTTTSTRTAHRFGGGHQRTATTADAGFNVPRGIPIERGRYAGPGPDYLGHQRDGHHGHGQGHGISGRAQSLDITGFDYGRYMRPVTPAEAEPGVAELNNENGTQLAQSFDTFTLSDQ